MRLRLPWLWPAGVRSRTTAPKEAPSGSQQHDGGGGGAGTGSGGAAGQEFAGLGLWGSVEAGCLAYVILHYFVASSVMVGGVCLGWAR